MAGCSARPLEFVRFTRRQVNAEFGGGDVSGDGGVLLLRQLDRRGGLLQRAASVLTDPRDPERITRSVADMRKQRVFGRGPDDEDLNDHREPRQDVLLQAAAVPETRLRA